MTLTRVAATLTAIPVLMALGAGPVLAAPVGGGGQPGPRTFVPSGLPVTLPAGSACTFAVTLTEVANKEFSREFPNGNVLTTGRLVIEITNDATGDSVVRNVSGPTLASGPDFILNGTSLSPVFAGNDDTGRVGQGLFIFHGPTVFTNFRLTRVSGGFENLCETLTA